VTALFLRDLKLSVRTGGSVLTGVLFFLAVVSVIPFAIGPDLKLLARIGPAVLWIGALLASLLGLDRLLQQDLEDGTLDILLMQGYPAAAVVFVKSLAHWVANGLPLVLAAPVFGLILNMSPLAIGASMLTLAVGTPAITFIGAVGAAVTVSLPRGGLLLALLILPLYIPILIFGVSAMNAVITGPGPFMPSFLILCALTLASLALSPFAAAAALRLNLS